MSQELADLGCWSTAAVCLADLQLSRFEGAFRCAPFTNPSVLRCVGAPTADGLPAHPVSAQSAIRAQAQDTDDGRDAPADGYKVHRTKLTTMIDFGRIQRSKNIIVVRRWQATG